ncbi:MAG: FkbM family methyltransferase [Ignavibacterium sp.]
MYTNKKIKILIEKFTGLHVYRTLPRGIEFFKDLKITIPDYMPEIIFDVGAHYGEAAYLFNAKCPAAQIYCFEPASKNFEILLSEVRKFKNVKCFRIALSSKTGDENIIVDGRSDMFHLANENDKIQRSNNALTEKIKVETIDSFCNVHKIEKINFLKVDTEGMDLEVLKGAEKFLRNQKIDFIQVEASMNVLNRYHVSFEVFKEFFEQYNYLLFGLYEQMNEWIDKKINLRRTNPVFVSQKIVESFPAK